MDVVLGRSFRALRIRRGLRQVDLARLAHVSRGMISKIERGEIAVVPLGVLRAVAGALVIEVKSVVPDSQAMLYGLDRNARLAPQLAEERGWE